MLADAARAARARLQVIDMLADTSRVAEARWGKAAYYPKAQGPWAREVQKVGERWPGRLNATRIQTCEKGTCCRFLLVGHRLMSFKWPPELSDVIGCSELPNVIGCEIVLQFVLMTC